MNASVASNSVIEQLVAFIRNERYESGDRLPSIRRLSQVLKAGRNVVRDGLVEAQSLGLVKIEPRQGVFVQGQDLSGPATRIGRVLERTLQNEEQNLFHLIDARLTVETQVAAEAARTRRPEDLLPLRQALEAVIAAGDDRVAYIEADQQFHLTISRIAGNRVLSTFLEIVWGLIGPAKSNVLLSSPSRQLSDREHREIFECIVHGDGEGARTKMDAHIRRGRELLVEYACTAPLPANGRISSNQSKSKRKIGGRKS